MSLLNQQQQDKVSAAIAAVETNTDAELVTVLAKQADSYYYIPTLWAAVLALLVPILLKLTPLWLQPDEILMAQWGTFIVAALLFRLPTITLWLVPAAVKRGRAASLARSQFLANNLHHTSGETGLLIFVSEAEHYVEIIADRGISQHVDDQQWQAIVNGFTRQIKSGDTVKGFVDCISECGEILAQHVPSSGLKDELPNHLLLI